MKLHTSYKIVSLFLSVLFLPICIQAHGIIIGAIQFPKTVQDIPTIRIRHCGRVIKCERNDEGKKIIFEIPKGTYQTSFSIIICDSVHFVPKSAESDSTDNTIEYLKIDTQKPYKLYTVTLMPNTTNKQLDPLDLFLEKEQMTYRWEIQEKMIGPSGRIPDDAIIIRYPANCIDTLRDESFFELPTIVMKENLIDLCGSHTKLAELSDVLALASLDFDTIHSVEHHQNQEIIKKEAKRVILAAPAA